MSRLSVYWPEDCSVATGTKAEPSMILEFPRPETRSAPVHLDVIARARVLYENRRCRHCSYPVVKPLELDDALVNSTGLDVPGTATLIGFECQSCEAMWPV